MKLKNLSGVILALALVFGLAACSGNGGREEDGESGEVDAISSAEQQEVIGQLAKEAEAVPEPDTRAAETKTAAPDSSSLTGDEKLLGEWADVNDASRFVKIEKNGDQYRYTDPDGTYTGTFEDGVLTIKISDAENDTAMVFIDSKTGNLVTNYQGDIYEFTRKVD